MTMRSSTSTEREQTDQLAPRTEQTTALSRPRKKLNSNSEKGALFAAAAERVKRDHTPTGVSLSLCAQRLNESVWNFRVCVHAFGCVCVFCGCWRVVQESDNAASIDVHSRNFVRCWFFDGIMVLLTNLNYVVWDFEWFECGLVRKHKL